MVDAVCLAIAALVLKAPRDSDVKSAHAPWWPLASQCADLWGEQWRKRSLCLVEGLDGRHVLNSNTSKKLYMRRAIKLVIAGNAQMHNLNKECCYGWINVCQCFVCLLCMFVSETLSVCLVMNDYVWLRNKKCVFKSRCVCVNASLNVCICLLTWVYMSNLCCHNYEKCS